MIIDGEEFMVGDEADYWIMYKAQRQRGSMNVYFKGQFIWVGWRSNLDPYKLTALQSGALNGE